LALDDIRIHVRFKLFALWTSLMFCYVYGDYFQLYQPGKLQGMLGGRTDLGPVSQHALLGMSAMLAVPALMAFLSLALPPQAARWTNIVLGVVYTIIMLLAIQGSWQFYIFFGVIEIVLTLLIAWHAWTWPKQTTP
jgi:hypothetical protein